VHKYVDGKIYMKIRLAVLGEVANKEKRLTDKEIYRQTIVLLDNPLNL